MLNSKRMILSSNRILIDVPEQIEDEIQGSFSSSSNQSKKHGMSAPKITEELQSDLQKLQNINDTSKLIHTAHNLSKSSSINNSPSCQFQNTQKWLQPPLHSSKHFEIMATDSVGGQSVNFHDDIMHSTQRNVNSHDKNEIYEGNQDLPNSDLQLVVENYIQSQKGQDETTTDQLQTHQLSYLMSKANNSQHKSRSISFDTSQVNLNEQAAYNIV